MFEFMKKWKTPKVISEDTLIKSLTQQRDMYKSRCIDLEDNIKSGFGVKIRNEITEIKIDFSLMELSVIHAAVCKLMQQPLSTDDAKYYLDLRIKLEDLLEKIKE